MADEGNAEAQNSYAFCLFNGFNVNKDQQMALHYFELAANNGNSEAQFYFSYFLTQEGDTEKATKYFQQSIDAFFPEAFSNYAQQLCCDNNNKMMNLLNIFNLHFKEVRLLH